MDNPFYAFCGLNCLECEARKATIDNDDELRKEVAEKWSKLNNVEIKPTDINCVGCRIEGPHSPFCEHLCPIKLCASKKGYKTCGDCKDVSTCEKASMILGNNNEARNNLGLDPLPSK